MEPFAGSACLFFHIAPCQALLGDINQELMLAYDQVRTDPEAVVTALGELGKSKSLYLRLRAADPSSLDGPRRAARFIYLNRYCFNGLYRTNRQGQFNVPYGGHKCGAKPSGEVLKRCSSLLAGAELLSGSFEATLCRVREGDFVYMDPPFSVKRRRVFREYDASVFGPEQIHRLRDWMHRLDEMGVGFVVSYADSHEARYLSSAFYVRIVTVRRSISGFATTRSPARELLISNRKSTVTRTRRCR